MRVKESKYYVSIIVKIIFTLEPWWFPDRAWRTVGWFGSKEMIRCSQRAWGGLCGGMGSGSQGAPLPPPPEQAGWVLLRPEEAGFWLTCATPFASLLWNVGFGNNFCLTKWGCGKDPPISVQ